MRSAARANPLIKVMPGLMIWTIVCFGITFFVLKRYAFGPSRRSSTSGASGSAQALAEADNAREEARKLLEEHRS